MKPKLPIYFDHAATGPLRPEVLEVMLPFLTENYGNASSRHHVYGWLTEKAVNEATKKIADVLGVPPNTVTFTSGATESVNTALNDFLVSNPKASIWALKTDHKACLDFLDQEKVSKQFIELDNNGQIQLDYLESLLKLNSNLILLSLLWVNNETGLICPVSEILELKKKYGFMFHLDISQGLGKLMPTFDFSDLDYLSLSAHKIYGPKGMGALVCKKPNQKLIFGGSQQRNSRGGTLNVPGIVGLGEALSLQFQNMEPHYKHMFELTDCLYSALQSSGLDFAMNSVYGKPEHYPGIVNVSFKGIDSETLIQKLNFRFAFSNGSACNAHSIQPSHVLMAMGQNAVEAGSAIRLSWGYQNSKEEVLEFVEAIKSHL
jgi:cysteine desulfurase